MKSDRTPEGQAFASRVMEALREPLGCRRALRLARWLGWREIDADDSEAIGRAGLEPDRAQFWFVDGEVCPTHLPGFFRPAESIADAELLLMHAEELAWMVRIDICGELYVEVRNQAGAVTGRALSPSINLPAAITAAVLEAIEQAGEP